MPANNRYVPKTVKESGIGHNGYLQAIYFIRDHERRIEKQKELIYPDGKRIGELKSSDTESQTEKAAIRIEKISREIRIVENALQIIPEEYREAIYNHVAHDTPFPVWANGRTMSRWKVRFVCSVALECGMGVTDDSVPN